MTTCNQEGGFTLVEVIVVLGVMGIILGTAVPLAGAVMQAERRQEATGELSEIAAALDAYWFDNASFPATLTASDFLGVHLQPGAQNTVVLDAYQEDLAAVASCRRGARTAHGSRWLNCR
jgi:prepilin-type N-terminal cleavage/methylation domain-containing protein